jgi:hypothetical protein
MRSKKKILDSNLWFVLISKTREIDELLLDGLIKVNFFKGVGEESFDCFKKTQVEKYFTDNKINDFTPIT